jgi:hypothetical protein
MKKIEATILLPALGENEVGEVTQRKFLYTIDGGTPTENTFPVEEMQRILLGDQGQAVHCELFNIDDAGNPSASGAVLDFVLADTTPPGAPGPMSFTMQEVDVPDQPPTP